MGLTRFHPAPSLSADRHSERGRAWCGTCFWCSDGGRMNCFTRPGVLGEAPAKPLKNALVFWIKNKNNGLAATYFRRWKPTIMGLTRFHFWVRNGIRWDTRSIATKPLFLFFQKKVGHQRHYRQANGFNHWIFSQKKLNFTRKSLPIKNDLLVALDLTHYCAYIWALSTSSSPRNLRYLILKPASRLYAFSAYQNQT